MDQKQTTTTTKTSKRGRRRTAAVSRIRRGPAIPAELRIEHNEQDRALNAVLDGTTADAHRSEQLWKVHQHLHRMLQRRGYQTHPDFATFHTQLTQEAWKRLSPTEQIHDALRWKVTTHGDDTMWVYFIDSVRADRVLAVLEREPTCRHFLFVSWNRPSSPPPPPSGTEVEYWAVYELTYDLLKFVGTVQHLGTDAKARAMAEERYGSIQYFPTQWVTLPVSRYFGAKVGDLFRYRRPDNHAAGGGDYYRIVVEGEETKQSISKAKMVFESTEEAPAQLAAPMEEGGDMEEESEWVSLRAATAAFA
jgi:hypothetical protein